VPITVNPLRPVLDQFYQRLTALQGVLFHLKTQLHGYRDMLVDPSQGEDSGLGRLFCGTRLVISDLTEWPAHGWRVNYPLQAFFSQGRQYVDMIDLIIRNHSQWTISQAYETFETYLYDVVASYLYHGQTCIEPALQKRLQRPPQDTSTLRQAVRQVYRGKQNRQIFAYLRRLAPELQQAEANNNRGMDLREWYEVVSEVRHAITHADSLIKSARTSAWGKPRLSLLNACFPGTGTAGGYRLSLEHDSATKALTMFAEYALQVDKYLCRAAEYHWSIQ